MAFSFLFDGMLLDYRGSTGLSYCSIPNTQHRIST